MQYRHRNTCILYTWSAYDAVFGFYCETLDGFMFIPYQIQAFHIVDWAWVGMYAFLMHWVPRRLNSIRLHQMMKEEQSYMLKIPKRY